MCGIVGKVGRNTQTDCRLVTAMRDRLAHRGPDDAGLWSSHDGRVVLGHRRLSILDLSTTGNQPMQSRCGRYVIVFNGEVYNYLELRSELVREGIQFLGTGDTEVVLEAFMFWGEHCLLRFNGMFSFVIYDRGTPSDPQRLFFARDRVGKKPFYYQHDVAGFSFASELKALDAREGVDLFALNHYLALGYVPAELCIAKGIAKLPPAHAGEYVLDNGTCHIWRYWSLPDYAPDAGVEVEELVHTAEALLQDSVLLRLRSDVPIGVLLSGGLDSSLVAACAAGASSEPIKTFTISFPGTRYDESTYANIVARHFSTEHHVLELPTPSLSTLDEFAQYIDEPLADSSIIPSFLVSRLTAQHVKVALGGDGGDELFGGYSDYLRAVRDMQLLSWVPGHIFKAASALARQLPAGVPGRNRIAALRCGPFQSIVWGTPYFDTGLRDRILDKECLSALGSLYDAPELRKLSLFKAGANPINSMTRTHFGSILPDDFLVKVDRTSMAVSLELRAPLLDVRMVEFAFAKIPSEWKVQGNISRRLQKRLARKMLPPELDLDRKQGFSIPLNEWLRVSGGEEVRRVRQYLPSCINQREIDSLLTGHAAGRANGGRLFALLMLALASKNLGWSF
ncbi:MAG: asparagine synthase [Desulfobulbaceae bacterium]|nr:MAG: asparagine synthase [Desulfobulbaceae bacterium]